MEKDPIHVMVWDTFDDIRCINLTSRPDRRQQAGELFAKLGVPIHWYNAVKHENPIQGCFESHIAVIREAYLAGHNHVVIFEDDLSIRDPPEKVITQMIEKVIPFIKENKYWDIFYLGSFPDIHRTVPHKVTDSIYRTRAIAAHAYIINRPAMRYLQQIKFIGKAFDAVLMDFELTYAIYPSLFYQGKSTSDISPAFYNQIDRTSFWRGYEYYATHTGVPLVTWFVTVLIILAIILVILLLEKRYPLVIIILIFLLLVGLFPLIINSKHTEEDISKWKAHIDAGTDRPAD